MDTGPYRVVPRRFHSDINRSLCSQPQKVGHAQWIDYRNCGDICKYANAFIGRTPNTQQHHGDNLCCPIWEVVEGTFGCVRKHVMSWCGKSWSAPFRLRKGLYFVLHQKNLALRGLIDMNEDRLSLQISMSLAKGLVGSPLRTLLLPTSHAYLPTPACCKVYR